MLWVLRGLRRCGRSTVGGGVGSVVVGVVVVRVATEVPRVATADDA